MGGRRELYCASSLVDRQRRRIPRNWDRQPLSATRRSRVGTAISPHVVASISRATKTAALPRSLARFDSLCVSRPILSIAASTLENPVDVANRRLSRVPAHDTVDATPACLGRHAALELRNP